MHRAGGEAEVPERLDRLAPTALHLAAVALCGLGFTFDLLEIALGNVLSAVFSTPPNLIAPQQLSVLLASTYVGAIIGAPAVGWLADRYGRRALLMAVLVFLALTSFLGASSPDALWLSLFRLMAGLALGGFPPLMIAYLTDLLPPRQRGGLILLAVAFASLGPPAGIFLIRWLTPMQPLGIEAWRWALLLAGAGAMIVGVSVLALPESPRWLIAKGRTADATAAYLAFERSSVIWERHRNDVTALRPPVRGPTIEADHAPTRSPVGRNQSRALLLSALYFLSPWATVAFPLLSGAVLVKMGYKLSDTLLYVGVTTFGPVAGTLAAMLVIDRIERRTTLALCAAAMASMGLAFARSETPTWLMTTGVAFTLFSALYVPALSVYAAELFPTPSRASASANAWAVNRVASALAPLVLLPLMQASGVFAMFAVIALTMVLSVILVISFGPRGKAGRPIE